jgi:hypothetical protein
VGAVVSKRHDPAARAAALRTMMAPKRKSGSGATEPLLSRSSLGRRT